MKKFWDELDLIKVIYVITIIISIWKSEYMAALFCAYVGINYGKLFNFRKMK